MRVDAVDLFCGIGGLTHGLIRGGVNVVAGIDLDPRCRYPFEANNAAPFIKQDVRDITAAELRSYWGRGATTLLAGCAPCQSFSTYSRKGRQDRPDDRWELVADFGRLAAESQPDLVTMENVPQLLGHEVFDRFLSTLKGYNVWYEVIQCARYRVPQTRKRLVLLASKFGPLCLPQPIATAGEATVHSAIAHLPRLSAGKAHPKDRLHMASRLSTINLERIRASKPGGSWRDWPPHLIAKCHKKLSGDTYPSVYGRMEWHAPSPTITTQCFGYGNGRFGHPAQNRAITLREAALLQTFPENYKFLPDEEPVKFSVLGRLIGNAVPVRLGEVVAETLVKHVRSVRPATQ